MGDPFIVDCELRLCGSFFIVVGVWRCSEKVEFLVNFIARLTIVVCVCENLVFRRVHVLCPFETRLLRDIPWISVLLEL